MSYIENLSQLVELKTLNLSFNRITKIEGIQNLKKLEVLELGKNFISDTDALQSDLNPLMMLSELYLYMNEIRSLPENMNFPLLKIANFNHNTDLERISLGYCPFLDTLTASYCKINQLGSLSGCPNLHQIDVSFNKLPTLESFVGPVAKCHNLQQLVFNDNVFNFNIQEDQNTAFRHMFLKLFPQVFKYNGDSAENQGPPRRSQS